MFQNLLVTDPVLKKKKNNVGRPWATPLQGFWAHPPRRQSRTCPYSRLEWGSPDSSFLHEVEKTLEHFQLKFVVKNNKFVSDNNYENKRYAIAAVDPFLYSAHIFSHEQSNTKISPKYIPEPRMQRYLV